MEGPNLNTKPDPLRLDLDEILGAARDYIFAVDEEGRILYANRDFMGCAKTALAGRNIFEFLARRSYRLKRALRLAFEERFIDYHEAIYRGPDGATIYFAHRISPLEREGKVICAVMVATDVTEQKEMDNLAKTGQALLLHGEKMLVLGEMAGGLAHELNTPLAAILLSTDQMRDILGETPLNTGDLLNRIDAVTTTTTKIASIVKAFRSFSREDASGPGVNFPCRQVVEEAVLLCEERFLSSGIRLETELTESETLCRGKPVYVAQALLNLLNNAWDAIRDSKGEKWVRIETNRKGSSIEFSVTDSGPGIPAEVREKIFQPFFTTKDVGQGTGLGLSVSRRLIENIGGRLDLDTGSPRTRFVVTVPVGDPA